MFANRKQALKVVGGLSKPSKMPCYGYSLPASACIMGTLMSKNPNSLCNKKICYARRGRYNFSNVQKALRRRLKSLDNPKWVDAMVFLIQKYEYFRWHDSGDLQSIAHLENIAQVALRTPNTIHWLPTREYQMVKSFVEDARKKAQVHNQAIEAYIPRNLVVRLSATTLEGKPPTALANSLGVLTSGVSVTDFNCPASLQKSKCLDCRKCWDWNVPNVNYRKH